MHNWAKYECSKLNHVGKGGTQRKYHKWLLFKKYNYLFWNWYSWVEPQTIRISSLRKHIQHSLRWLEKIHATSSKIEQQERQTIFALKCCNNHAFLKCFRMVKSNQAWVRNFIVHLLQSFCSWFPLFRTDIFSSFSISSIFLTFYLTNLTHIKMHLTTVQLKNHREKLKFPDFFSILCKIHRLFSVCSKFPDFSRTEKCFIPFF